MTFGPDVGTFSQHVAKRSRLERAASRADVVKVVEAYFNSRHHQMVMHISSRWAS